MFQGICRSCKSFKKNLVFSFHIKKSQRRYVKSKIHICVKNVLLPAIDNNVNHTMFWCLNVY